MATAFPALAVGFTLMPIGTAFLFPCVTGLLSRVVPSNERGLYMGVQHTFGGVSRVAFPITAGFLMDHAGIGVPFWLSGILVLGTLPLASALLGFVPAATTTPVPEMASIDITDQFPTIAAEGKETRD